MARYIILAICLVQLLVCACACSSGGRSSGGGGSSSNRNVPRSNSGGSSNNRNVPRSNSGRPSSVVINENTEARNVPRSNSGGSSNNRNVPSSNPDINENTEVQNNFLSNLDRLLSVDISDKGKFKLLDYNSKTGTLGVGMEIRPSEDVEVDVHTGLDKGLNPVVAVGATFKFKRSIENATADTIHRELFSVLDSNKDGQLDVAEWSGEGGKVLSFASLIVDHDQDKDEKISLAEFQQTRIQPGLRMILDRLDSFLSKDHEE